MTSRSLAQEIEEFVTRQTATSPAVSLYLVKGKPFVIKGNDRE